MTDRERKIVRTSFLGIGVNLVLVAFKAAVGFLSGSIAVVLDAVNNLSDALSSVITIVGTRIAGRAPDKKHPYGHGRVEYLTGVLVAVLVLFAGAVSLKESAEKIFFPVETDYTPWSFLILGTAVLVKFFLGRYVKKTGQKLQSQALTASGADAFFDAILSLGTLAAAVISVLFPIAPEGYFGLVISFFILKSGFSMLSEALVSVIGERADADLTRAIKEKVASYPEVMGVYDLTLHNYGPTRIIGSVHIELQDDTTAKEIHALTRRISAEIYQTFGIVLTVGIYASNRSLPESEELREEVEALAMEREDILEIHGFYFEPESKNVTFDLVVNFKADAEAVRDELLQKLREKHPDLHFYTVLDSDYSD